jgi:flagellar hook-associated protein 2
MGNESLFQIGGLASGIDTNGIIDAMMKLASRPVDNLKKEKQMLSFKQEAYNNLSVKLLALQSQMANLADEDFFTSRVVSSSNSSVATASSESGALQTTYNLTVDNIATSTSQRSSQSVTSSGSVSSGSGITTENDFSSAGFASTPSGSVTITMDSGASKTFNLSDYATVDDFMWAINHDSTINVRMEYDSSTDKFNLYSRSEDGFSISETAGGTGVGFFSASGFYKQKTSSDTVSSGSGIDITKSFADAGFKNTIDGTVTINGKTFDPNSYDTVEQFMNAVNADSDAKVTLSYDSGTDKFTIKSDVLGERINLSETGTHPFFTEVNIKPEYVNGIDPTKDLVNADTHIPVEDNSIFRINGVEFTVDKNVDSLNDIIQDINNSSAGVIAFYDPSTDTLSLQSKETGAKSLSLEDVQGNFLKAFKLIDSNDTYTSGKEVVSGSGNLDTSQSWAAAGFDTTPDGSVLINGVEFNLSDYATVDDFMNAINNNTSANANISYDASKDKFTITSTNGKNLELSETGTNPFFTEAKIEYQNNLIGTEELGKDAQFTLNGTAMTKSENTFTMNGTTFTLSSAGSATITVNNDNDKIVKSVKDFVKAYNDTMDYLREKLTEKSVSDPKTADDYKKGILNGDSTLLEIQNQLREIVSSQVTDLDGKANELQDIGINSGPVGSSVELISLGHLFVDEDQLRSVLNDDPEKVALVFGKDWVEVDGENPAGVKDGSNKTFTIANTPVSFGMQPIVRLNGTVLKQVFGTTTTPTSGQFKLDYSSGELDLGDAPASTDTLTIDYKYKVETGDKAGIGVRLLKKLKAFTEVNDGLVDSQIKSLEDRGSDIDEQIKNYQYRLDLERQQLIEKYSAMEDSISKLKSQGDYMAAQLASLTGDSSKKK